MNLYSHKSLNTNSVWSIGACFTAQPVTNFGAREGDTKEGVA